MRPHLLLIPYFIPVYECINTQLQLVALLITLGIISTVYVSPGFTPNSVTLVLLTVIGDWSELTLCVIM